MGRNSVFAITYSWNYCYLNRIILSSCYDYITNKEEDYLSYIYGNLGDDTAMWEARAEAGCLKCKNCAPILADASRILADAARMAAYAEQISSRDPNTAQALRDHAKDRRLEAGRRQLEARNYYWTYCIDTPRNPGEGKSSLITGTISSEAIANIAEVLKGAKPHYTVIPENPFPAYGPHPTHKRKPQNNQTQPPQSQINTSSSNNQVTGPQILSAMASEQMLQMQRNQQIQNQMNMRQQQMLQQHLNQFRPH